LESLVNNSPPPHTPHSMHECQNKGLENGDWKGRREKRQQTAALWPLDVITLWPTHKRKLLIVESVGYQPEGLITMKLKRVPAMRCPRRHSNDGHRGPIPPFHFPGRSYNSPSGAVCTKLNTRQKWGPNGKGTGGLWKSLTQECRGITAKREEGKACANGLNENWHIKGGPAVLFKGALGRSLSKRERWSQPSQPAFHWLRTYRVHFAIRDHHGRPANWRWRNRGSDAQGCRREFCL
jgi:hypothetical protein